MFENIMNFFKKFSKKDKNKESSSAAKERLHLVLMQDRANVSADFLELMRQEIIEVIKKYIDIDEKAIDVKLTNKMNEDGTVGAPALYANIPIVTIKNEAKKVENTNQETQNKNKEVAETAENKEEIKQEEKSDEEVKDNKEGIQDTEKKSEEVNKIGTAEENKEKEEASEKTEEIKEKEDETKKEQEHTEKQSSKQKVETNS